MEHKRIVVIGASATGKTTFARRLGEKLHIQPTHLDAVMWRSGWRYIGDEQTAAHIAAIVERPEWIIEGYVVETEQVTLFDTADVILYLDYPGWLSAWRYIQRWWKHHKNPRPELPGSPETFSFRFLKLVYFRSEMLKVEELFREHNWNEKIIRFTHPEQAAQFLTLQ